MRKGIVIEIVLLGAFTLAAIGMKLAELRVFGTGR